jgi:hypothetical protein
VSNPNLDVHTAIAVFCVLVTLAALAVVAVGP